jgi:YidC/Oxa1 family membrane protein insertase
LPEIHNPNLQSQGSGSGGGGGDMRSTMAFMLLAIVLFMGYEYFLKPKTEPTPPAQTQSQSQGSRSTPQNGKPAADQAQPAAAAHAAHGVPAAAEPTIAATSQTETTVENELYKIVLTNRGGQIEHWILKKYKDSDGKPLDMVQPQVAAKFGLPLSYYTYDPSLTKELNQALYQVKVSGAKTSGGALLAPASITFRYAAHGLDVVKSIYFNSSYVISVDTEVKRDGEPMRALVAWPAGLGDMEEFGPSFKGPVFTSAASQFAWSLNGKEDTLKATKVSGDATLNEPYSYAAVADLYFAAAFLPYDPDHTTVVTLHHEVELPGNPGNPGSAKKPAQAIGLAMGDTTGLTHLRLFAGPKETDVLNSIHAIGTDGKADGQSLAPLIHFGWFTVIAKPLYLAMRFLRGLLGPGNQNWGWSILIVTLIINMLMLPTRLIMMRSSLKMMRIQPKVDALKRKYAHLKLNDPKKAEMNTEMMALYKAEGVNMYGGCLPMLIQMPLLYAIYEVLENAIELRQAHWLWLPDLSMPDPLYILPILIILTMFLVQYITPSPGMDPAQRRMMAFFMPVIFGFTMLHFPSGLALYWGMGNVINLAIQIGINQSKMGKEMHAIAARRAAKKAAGSVGQRSLQGRR